MTSSHILITFTSFPDLHNKYGKNIFANPKNKKNPKTSVAVVKNIADANAGSTPNTFNNKGIKKPKKPAITKFPIIAAKIMIPR
ncbi:hypothetical protein D3C76_1735910 [compost metagenome]